MTYDHKHIEEKWRDIWANQKLNETPNKKDGSENMFVLTEFPYPSGNLHIGHWYAFTGPDIYARFQRMNGKNVLFPAGFDAFGLPAENAAIKHGLSPRTWTYENMDRMRTQMRSMGVMYDWSREVVTCDPAYYKWTQWLFLQLHNAGLVTQKETAVNWCPSCKTVLANEQVVSNACERCDSEVEQRDMLQWNIAITRYADRLLEDLEALDWPEPIKESQRNWIGKSSGAEIVFALKDSEHTIPVFTTRPDTLFGATYMVLAPEHPLLEKLKGAIRNWETEVVPYMELARKKTEIERTNESKEKTGVQLEGIVAINPANGDEIPVFIADYVLGHYGTGAIMAVPAHDERDYAFAKAYDLPVRTVVARETGTPRENEESRDGGAAVIFDPAQQKYAVAQWCDDGRLGLYAGGVDEGETVREAIVREVREESGLYNFKDIEWIDVAYAHYHNKAKNINRLARAEALLLILENADTQDTTLEEHENFELVWRTADEIMENWRERNSNGTYDHYIEFLTRGVARAIERGDDTTSDAGLYTFKPRTEVGIVENSEAFSGMNHAQAVAEITKHAGGELKNTYKLRDWIVSRQRYWGVPIPIIHCASCGAVPVPDEQLPVELPDIDDYLPTGDGKSPLAKATEWVATTCPTCGEDAQRETDTFDTFVDSAWYYLRYTDAHNTEQFADKEKQDEWLPVDVYSGGAEHTTMHLLYSRFWHKALFDLGLVSAKEPYTRRLNRGIILGPDGNKMSKSKGNVIDPDEVVEKLGADTVRTYLGFIGPFNEVGHYPWSTDGIVGIRRFLERFHDYFQTWKRNYDSDSNYKEQYEQEYFEEEIERKLSQAIKQVSEDVTRMKFNTAISALMTFLNVVKSRVGSSSKLEQTIPMTKPQMERLAKALAPFAPHLAEELWHEVLGNTESIHISTWPTYDAEKLVEQQVTIAVQINGKVRGNITVPTDSSEENVLAQVTQDAHYAKWLEGETKRIIFVPNKLINIVVGA